MSERQTIARHAGTVLIGQLAVMAFGITDAIVAGRYDTKALAALSVGSSIFITVFVALMGILQALLPMLSEHRGANRLTSVGKIFRQSLYLCIFGSAIGSIILLSPEFFFNATEIPTELRIEVSHYLAILTFALPTALFFRMFGTLNQSLGHPKNVTLIQIAGFIIKVPLSIILTFGMWGIPEQGLIGCAYATLIVNLTMALTAVAILKINALYHPYEIWKKLEAPDWVEIKKLLKIGVPNGLSITVEVTSFTLMALFIARMGTHASASHQVVASMAALTYMIPLSLSIATSARVSYWIGAENQHQMKQAIRSGFEITILCALVNASLLALLRYPIASLYAKDPQVVEMAALLLGWLSLYHLADSMQVMCFFLLRCFRITLSPLLIYSTLLWGVGLMGGYFWAYGRTIFQPAVATPEVFWISSSFALCFTSTLLIWILNKRLSIH